MATKKKTEVVETADLKPKVTRKDEPFRGWKYSTDYVVCPHCGATARITAVRLLKHCPVCGETAE